MKHSKEVASSIALGILLSVSIVFGAPATVVTNVGQSFALHGVEGRKFAESSTGFRVVYSTSAGVFVSTSSNGTTGWSTPLLLAAGGTKPSIAVARNGVAGVAFHKNSTIYYSYSTGGTIWSSAMAIRGGSEAAITAFRNDIHIAITDGSVRWGKFPANNPVSLTTTAETVMGGILCGTSVSAKPTIAVIPQSKGSLVPLVLVGFLYSWSSGTSCGTNIDLFTVFARVGGGWQSAGLGAGGSGAVSISVAGNNTTGDCYVALSYVQSTTDEAVLNVKNMWANSPMKQIKLLNRRAIVSVAAYDDVNSRFRIAVSDFTKGSNGYGPAWYRSGTWAGGSSTPTWDGPQVNVSSSARDVQALTSETLKLKGGGGCPTTGVLTKRYALIDESGTGYNILLDTDNTKVQMGCDPQ